MPPKNKKPSGGGASNNKDSGKTSAGGEDKREEPLQAVILADDFETRFNPFTLERPRCLLALANTPLIEYTLAFLAGIGVEQVFCYMGNGHHVEQVEEYLQ